MSVIVVIPCLDEALSVGHVVSDFRAVLPTARIVVVDNGSTDDTAAVAAEAGAHVVVEPRPGKGAALRCAFQRFSADVWVLVDGDHTYDASAAPRLIQRLQDGGLDVVNGARTPVRGALLRRRRVGNRAIAALLRRLFGSPFRDPLSGYKVLSSAFVAGFPSRYDGFEVETELVVHAVRVGAGCDELETSYRPRPEGSSSKLSAVRDGSRIAAAMLALSREH